MRPPTKASTIFHLFLCTIIYFFCVSVTTAEANARTLKTGGTDYALYMVQTEERMLEESTWLGNNHDLIISPSDIPGGGNGRSISVEYYDAIMTANPNAIIITYVPYNTVTQVEKDWMENWAVDNGHDIEDLYYHYYVDTTVQSRNGDLYIIPGFGGGSASTLAESRVPSLWLDCEFPNVAPTLPVFREAYIEYLKYRMVLVGAESDPTKRLKGVLLDTFDGTINGSNGGNFNIFLNNVREIRLAVKGSVDATMTGQEGRDYVAPQMISHVKEMTTALETEPGIDKAWVFPNMAEMAQLYYWFRDLGGDAWDAEYNKVYNEYFVKTSVMRQSDLAYMTQLYDDMEDGYIFATQAEAGFVAADGGSSAPERWIKGCIARLYLVAHPNQFALYHAGAATYYGPVPRNSVSGSYAQSAWHPNMGYDLGSPVVRSGVDYWGETNTDRFFTLHHEPADNWYCIAREFDQGLVMQVFGNGNGQDAVGTVPHTVPLGSTYRELLSDNSLGEPITELTLGLGEGAILIKEASTLLSITSISLSSVTVGQNYLEGLTVSGGTAPYSWSVITGTLPEGITLDTNTGVLSGTPTVAGVYDFTVEVTDSATPTPNTDTQELSISVSSETTHTVTFIEGANGSRTGGGELVQTVNHGSAATAPTITANAGYTFDGWDVPFTNVTSDLTVTAQYTQNSYTLTYTAGANGSITGTSPQIVLHGANAETVTALPDTGYYFVNWSDNVITASRTDTNVTANITVTANFEIDTIPAVDLKINFQPAAAAVPDGYLVDSGAAFGDRGNGYSYGWNVDCAIGFYDRDNVSSPDQRYDTLGHMRYNSNSYTWEIALPNGDYSVRLVAGEPIFDATYNINAEDVNIINGTAQAPEWIDNTLIVTITDGRLTLTNADTIAGNNVCFIEITSAGPASIVPGDIDQDGDIDLRDAILGLQIATGGTPETISPDGDVDGDGKIGIEEVIYILQSVQDE